jgi:hypothetical protein
MPTHILCDHNCFPIAADLCFTFLLSSFSFCSGYITVLIYCISPRSTFRYLTKILMVDCACFTYLFHTYLFHTFSYAHYQILFIPRSYGYTSKQLIAYFRSLFASLCAPNSSSPICEVFYAESSGSAFYMNNNPSMTD